MNDICKQVPRAQLMAVENFLKTQEGFLMGDNDLCPLKHTFTDGIYVREIFIPAGAAVVGKIHKHRHPNFLMSGTVRLITEDGYEEITGPKSIVSKEGTKRVLFAMTDLVWITVHHNPTNTEDLQKIENIVIADSYQEYDRFISSKSRKITLFLQKLTRKLLWHG